MTLSCRDMQGQTLVVRQERCCLLRRHSGHGQRERQGCRLELKLGAGIDVSQTGFVGAV